MRLPAITGPVFRCTNFFSLYPAPTGPAVTGSWFRKRAMSLAKPAAVAYHRSRSLFSVFSTIQSSSPRTNRPSLVGSICRLAAALGVPSAVLIRLDGTGDSCSRTSLNISSNTAFLIVSRVSGVVPVSNSYRMTPNAYTSARVSTSVAWNDACSGAMYIGVPSTVPNPVCRLCSDRAVAPTALASPKSITFGTGFPSRCSTKTLDGLRSR